MYNARYSRVWGEEAEDVQSLTSESFDLTDVGEVTEDVLDLEGQRGTLMGIGYRVTEFVENFAGSLAFTVTIDGNDPIEHEIKADSGPFNVLYLVFGGGTGAGDSFYFPMGARFYNSCLVQFTKGAAGFADGTIEAFAVYKLPLIG